MKEIEIKDGTGDYNIFGTKDCIIFEYKNRSKFLVWEMNWNSLMNFFVGQIAKKPILYLQYFRELELNLEEGRINEANLKAQISPLLKGFGNAKYKLEIVELMDSFHIVKVGVSTDFYPKRNEYIISKVLWAGGHPFVYAIQESINEKTVDHYKELIKTGVMPQLIFMTGINSEIQIVLDGHHKLEAYNQLGVNPICIQITKMTNYLIPDEKIIETYKKYRNEENEDLEIRLRTHLKKVNTDTNTVENDKCR